ncbi:MAG: SRPBCC domain-containing protein [Gemmatimonadales bacterium]
MTELSLSGTQTITAPAERVWARLLDLPALAGSSSAVESIEEIEPHHFTVQVAIGLGFFKLRTPIDVRLTDLVEPHSGTLMATGEAMGTTVNARTSFTIVADPSGVRLDWAAAGDISGKLAGMAGAGLEGTLRRLSEEFWEGFAQRAAAGT